MLDNVATRDAMLRRAFRLAYFIHGERELAVRIVAAAMSKLDAAAVAQDKRSYYKPGGRSHAPGGKVINPRTKVSLNKSQLLQRLVYVESEPHERQEEQRRDAAIDEEMLITRYVKHLINITLMRNSFHVTLGVSRLLYNYTTAESMGLYALIMQDPERAKDDAYWRERKARLMRELKERFGRRLAVARGARGEERFQALGDSARYAGIVKQCLQMFTPWDMPCPLPGSGSAPDEIEALTFHGSDPDEEHQIEVARMHSVIHPDCYEQLVARLGLDPPASRLEIPKFFHVSDRGPEDGSWYDREDAEATEYELGRMRKDLDDPSARRKRPGDSPLRVMVDGVERAVLEIGRKREAPFEVEEDSKLIEVRTAHEEGDLLLAVHIFSYDDAAQTAGLSRFSTRLGGGRKISFTISPLRQLHEEDDGVPVFGVSVVASYEESHPIPALGRAWRRLGRRLPRVWHPQRRAAAWVLAAIFLAAGISDLARLLTVRERAPQQSQVAENKELVTVKSPLPSIPPGGAPPSATASLDAQEPRTALPLATASEPALKAPFDVLQYEAGASASLLGMKKICVEVTGDRQVDPAIVECLNRSLRASRRWATATSDKADALLSVGVGFDGREIYVRLINQEGKILWPGGDGARKYGATAEAVAKVVADMLADVRELERGRRERQ